ncbi:MAG TPA: magnesium chelatase, partial [Syntrophomonadaceae bacterium]|nr:magnesium chelatase [Syntrophomonadaceae bacterium]
VVDLTVNVSVWAASNPDEDPGPLEEIRRQLSDRFDMVCYMGRPTNVEVLSQILKENSHVYKLRKARQDQQESDTEIPENEVYRQNIIKWAEQYNKADLPDFLRNYIARLYIRHNLESIRAIEAMQQGALLHSIIKNHDQAMIQDVTSMIPQVLKHRVEGDTLVKIINDVDARGARDGIVSLRSKKSKRPEAETDSEYFKSSGKPLRDIGRNELINTEKSLNPDI